MVHAVAGPFAAGPPLDRDIRLRYMTQGRRTRVRLGHRQTAAHAYQPAARALLTAASVRCLCAPSCKYTLANCAIAYSHDKPGSARPMPLSS